MTEEQIEPTAEQIKPVNNLDSGSEVGMTNEQAPAVNNEPTVASPAAAEEPAPSSGESPLPAGSGSKPEEKGRAEMADTAQMPADEPNAVEAPAPGQSAPKSVETPDNSYLLGLLQKARQIFNSRKRKKLNKILDYADKNGRINNDQVEKLLRVSDATATRYLRALVKEGKLALVGKGKNTYYQKTENIIK